MAGAARADIKAYVDASGRKVYVNTADSELSAAARQGGASAALQVLTRRQKAQNLDRYIEQQALALAVDPALVNAVIEVESAWNPKARSAKGAMGLMQLMPGTAARLGVGEPFDAKQNVGGGIRYLRALLDRFRGDVRLVLAAYNAGEKIVMMRHDVPRIAETENYVRRVSDIYGKLKARVAAVTVVARVAQPQPKPQPQPKSPPRSLPKPAPEVATQVAGVSHEAAAVAAVAAVSPQTPSPQPQIAGITREVDGNGRVVFVNY